MFEGGSLGHFKGSKKRHESSPWPVPMRQKDKLDGKENYQYAWRKKKSLKMVETGRQGSSKFVISRKVFLV